MTAQPTVYLFMGAISSWAPSRVAVLSCTKVVQTDHEWLLYKAGHVIIWQWLTEWQGHSTEVSDKIWRCVFRSVDIMGWLHAQFCGITNSEIPDSMTARFMPLVLCHLHIVVFSILVQKSNAMHLALTCCVLTHYRHITLCCTSTGSRWMETMLQSCTSLELMASQNCTSILACSNMYQALTDQW